MSRGTPASPDTPGPLDVAPGEMLVTHHLVVWMDVLGQRALLREIPTIASTSAEAERLGVLLRRTAGTITMARDLARRYFEYAKDDLPHTLAGLVEGERLAVVRRHKVSIQSFSDTIIVTASLANTDEH